MMRIIIVGASGTIGHQLFNDTKSQGIAVIGTYQSHSINGLIPFDITRTQLKHIIPDLSSNDVIVLLAAHKNLNWIHTHPDQAAELNIVSTKRIIEEIIAVDGKIVFLSSEQVFDGKTGGYHEHDIPDPQTTYGQQKLIIENQLINSYNKSIVIRTGATVSPRLEDDCLILNTYQTLLKPHARMAKENILSLTAVEDTSEQILNLIRSDERGIFHVTATPGIARIELASLIIKYSQFGNKMHFTEVDHQQIKYPEQRPLKSWLSNKKIQMKYNAILMPADELIRHKTALIDSWYQTNKLSF